MKRFCITLVAMVMCTIGYSFEVKNSDGVTIFYSYRNNSTQEVEVTTGYSKKYTGSVVIPEEVSYLGKKYKVTGIANNAFKECYDLTSVTIPEGVISIGDYAFYQCENLLSVTIPNSVTSIGSYAFYNCYDLSSVTLPEELTTIEIGAFVHCSSFTSITIPSKVTHLGGAVFQNCYKLNSITCLNTTPPDIEMSGVFWCSLNNVSDANDIYTYVPLHVPKGSGDLYAATFEWRNFKKIREDIELDETELYADLTIKQGEIGYTRQTLNKGATYKIFIGSLGNYKVNTVTFNSEDVTKDVVDGYFTIPALQEDSELSISYEKEITDIRSISSLTNVKVTAHNGEINISNIDESSTVSVYSSDGKLTYSIPSALGSVRVPIHSEGLYLVKVGSRSYSIAL